MKYLSVKFCCNVVLDPIVWSFLDTNDNFSPVCYQRLQLLTESYLENGEEPFTVDILKEMTSKDLTMNI